jgi:hypothetical protein
MSEMAYNNAAQYKMLSLVRDVLSIERGDEKDDVQKK